MATGNCTYKAAVGYNGGWDTDNGKTAKWGNQLGYAGDGKCYVIKLQAPSFTGTAQNNVTKLSGTIKIRRAGQSTNGGKGKGTVKVKIFTADPATKVYSSLPNFSSGAATLSWERTAAGWANFTYSINTTSIPSGKIFYLGFGPGSGNVAEFSVADFSATVTYTAININTIAKPTIFNHKDSTFSITASAGTPGTGNTVYSTTLYYTVGNGSEQTASGLSVTHIKLSDCGIARTTKEAVVKARVVADSKYGADATASATNVTVQNYQAPSLPTNAPEISKTKNRFTIKENWTATWDPATKANDNSAVKGYEVVLRKNNTNIVLGNATSTNRTWTIDPIELEVSPKDTIQIGVKPYTTNGAGTKIYNANYKYGPDPAITVQNAAVVRVKVGTGKNTWVEGQVWIKGSDKKWHEADVVKIKTDDGWKESE